MKSLSKIVSIVVSALFFVSVVGCGGEKINPNELKIVYLLGGYGSGWIEELKTVFEAEHPGIGVRLEGSKSAKSQAEKNIGSSKNTDDLYIVTGYNWQMAAAQGKLLSLDGLYGEPVGGGDETLLKDKILDVYANAVKAEQGGEQHYYRVPWTAATGGIFYNAKMFREKGWQVPQTYGELVALCETIKSAQIPIDPNDQFSEKVKPFVWTGGEEYYWDYLVFDWWGQIAGIDEINKFLEYKSATVYDGNSTDGAAYKSLKRAYELWYNLIAANYGDTNSNSMGDSVAKAYMIAQQNFVSGKAAMIPNGHWLYNEMLEVMPAGFEMDIMPAPWVDGAQVDNGAVTLAAKTDSDGEKVRASYLI
jgi:N-acetylglucosamine transport system substrate-binding protein